MNKKIILPFVTLIMVLAMVGAASAATVDKIEIRGQVINGSLPNGEFEWNATNFAAFWYDLDDNLETERLILNTGYTLNAGQREIAEDALTYVTEPEPQTFEACEDLDNVTVEDSEEGTKGEETAYNIVGWMAEKYIGVNGRADVLAKLLVEFEGDDKKTLSTGEEWDLGGGFSLVAQQIDLEGNKVWLQLNKNGKEVDSEVIGKENADDQDMLYVHVQDDVGGEDDVPIFVAYVDAVFRGTDTNIVQVKYVWLMSDEPIEITTSDSFGDLDVTTANKDKVELSNDDNNITLSADDTISIFGDVKFKVADSDTLRFYPFAEKTIGEVADEVDDDDDEVDTPIDTNVTDDANVTPTDVVSPTPDPSPIVSDDDTATDADNATDAESAETEKPGIPGFEAGFAIAGLLAVAYLVLRQRE